MKLNLKIAIFLLFFLLKKYFGDSKFNILEGLSPNMTTNSLKAIKKISFIKQEFEKMQCLSFCERQSDCDLVLVQSFICELFTILDNVTFIEYRDARVFVKVNARLRIFPNKVIGEFFYF